MENTKRISISNDTMNPPQGEPPQLCSNGCGFYGTAAKNSLCSKCFADLIIKNTKSSNTSNFDVVPPPIMLRPLIIKNKKYNDFSKLTDVDQCQSSPEFEEEKNFENEMRCGTCEKKIGFFGFECRCGNMFCWSHRFPEEHVCDFDFKERAGKSGIAKVNDIVKTEKLKRLFL